MGTSQGRMWIVGAFATLVAMGVYGAGCSSSSSPAAVADAGQNCPLTFDAANGGACIPGTPEKPFLCSYNYTCTGTLTENSHCVCNATTNKFDCFDSVNTNTPISVPGQQQCVNDTSENPVSCPTKESDGTACTNPGQVCAYYFALCSDGSQPSAICECDAVGNAGTSGSDAGGFAYTCDNNFCGGPQPDAGTVDAGD